MFVSHIVFKHRRSFWDELCQLYDVIYKTYILHHIVGKVRHKTNACVFKT